MAEVLTPMIGSSSTMTMLHSPSDAFQPTSPSQPHLGPARVNQVPRAHLYNPHVSGLPYRQSTSMPVAPYAFQSTPHLRQEHRTLSAPTYRQSIGPIGGSSHRYGHHDSSSESTVSTASSSNRSFAGGYYTVSKDDSVLDVSQRQAKRLEHRHSTALVASLSTPDLSLTSLDVSAKPSPDRYRRSSRRFDNPASVPALQQVQHIQQIPPAPRLSPVPSEPVAHKSPERTVQPSLAPMQKHQRSMSGDETSTTNRMPNSTRYKRRSVGIFDSSPAAMPVATPVTASAQAPTWSQIVAGSYKPLHPPQLPVPASRPMLHLRTSSGGRQQVTTSPKRPASAKYSSASPRPTSVQSRPTTAPSPLPNHRSMMGSRSVPDLHKRFSTGSSLSKPVTASHPEPAKSVEVSPKLSTTDTTTKDAIATSPAMQQLSALNDMEKEKEPATKTVKSRLRRAFSFSSSQELRRATAENNLAAEKAKVRKEKYESEREVEDAAVVAKQEAGGIGVGIYSGLGSEFHASKDNISISSTASSASVMLRKMGQGVRRSTKGLKNLFRSKSATSSATVDTSVSDSAAGTTEISNLTVEAERERVNVNLDPHDKPGGGTGYPRLERNSMDAGRDDLLEEDRHQDDQSLSRKSIVGGDRERAEVLAAVKKGILKRTGTGSTASSPSISQGEMGVPHFPVAGESSATTVSEGSEKDYFIAESHYAATSTKSLPSTSMRNISFNSRVQFHDVWSSTEYDRRGDIATCNRLTPMLAQQIKEELNSFKMEMEVHEESKPHTHFF